MGCRGPVTYNACSVTRWNDGISYPIQSGHGCIGCSEAGFWDNGPFYQHLGHVPGVRNRKRRRTQVGAVVGIATAVGLAGHAALTAIRKRDVIAKHETVEPGRVDHGETGVSSPWPAAASSSIRSPASRATCASRQVEDGKVTDAYSSGTMVRGFEMILHGRDPRDAWAFTERTCGVCTTVHALASVRTVEDALGISVPPNAELIRNLMFCTQYVQDHVVHFYHLHALDWVDVVSALKADPAKTSRSGHSISNWPKSSPGYFADVQKRLKNSWRAGSWASSPTATGAIRPTSCRRRRTSWRWRIISRRWSGRKRS